MGKGVKNILNKNCKIILIFYSLSFILWLFTIAITSINYLIPEDFLGSSGRLPIYFWLALILVSLGIIKTYFINNLTLFYCGLVLLILILFMTYPLIEPSGRHPVSYQVSGISEQIVDGTYLSSSYEIPWLGFPYIAYKGFPLFVTIFIELTELPILTFIKFSPAFIILITTFIIYAFYYNLSEKSNRALIAATLFVPLCYWHLFSVPELLTYALLPTFLFLVYLNSKKPHMRYSLLYICVLLSIIITHLLAPFVIIIYSVIYNIINFYFKKINLNLSLLSIALFFCYLIYVGYSFYNNAIIFILESFENFDILTNRLTVGEIGRSQSPERIIGIFANLSPLIICILISLLVIYVIILNKRYKSNTLMISYFMACLLLFLIPYGGDVNIGRTAYFINIGTAYFVSCLPKNYVKPLFILIVIFILIHPIAYSGGGTKTSVIPISELAGTKFFADKTEEKIYYFSQSAKSIIYYQDPYNAFKRSSATLWYPPLAKFYLDKNFDYILHSVRDHTGLIYYLGYDPIFQNINKINNLFVKVYDSRNFEIYYKERSQNETNTYNDGR